MTFRGTRSVTSEDAESSPKQARSDSRRRWLLDWSSATEYTCHSVKREIYRKKSDLQEIEILDLETYGRCLILDGETQSFEGDEHIYHETMVHPLLLGVPEPRRILVIGGGEGAAVREALRHKSVEKVVMVDRDRMVVDACVEHLPTSHAGAFDDPRTEVVIAEGRSYLENASEPFDAVIVDVNDSLAGGACARLFTVEFLELVLGKLTPQGGLAIQTGSASLHCFDGLATVLRSMAEVFGEAHPATNYVPSFSSEWSFAYAGPGLQSPKNLTSTSVDARIASRIDGSLRYYDGETHQNLFSLVRYLRDGLATRGKVVRDEDVCEIALPDFVAPGTDE